MKKGERRRGDVILLRDLAPRQEIKAGAGKRVFGAPSGDNEGPQRGEPDKKAKKRKARVDRI
jgi:hypothetical protein